MFLKKNITFIIFLFLISSCNRQIVNQYGIKRCYNRYYNANKSYTVFNKKYIPFRNVIHYSEIGIASWYGSRKDKTNGKRTAGGDIYNKRKMTAAHKTLPLLSVVLVTNLINNKKVKLVITDRGPFFNKRIIDVSEKAAEKLNFKKVGIAKVKVEFLKDETFTLIDYVKRNKNCKPT